MSTGAEPSARYHRRRARALDLDEEALPSRRTCGRGCCSASLGSSTHPTLDPSSEDGREDTVSLPISDQYTGRDYQASSDEKRLNKKEAELLVAECEERYEHASAILESTDAVEVSGGEIKAEHSA